MAEERGTAAAAPGMPANSIGPLTLIDIVIVNWNSGSYLRDCLLALNHAADVDRWNLIVVDNASTDHSAVGLRVDRAQPRFIRNADNRGFAKASNQGAREGSAPYLLFLNPDVRVAADTVKTAVAVLDDPRHADVGILGVQLIDKEGRIQRCCARAPTASTLLLHRLFLDRLCPGLVPPHFLTGWDHCATAKVDQVMGAFLLIRRPIFEQLGGFDERFFLYYEDVDLCLAARQAGWRVLYFAGARAIHAGGGSTDAVKGERLHHLAISRTVYAAKWHGRLAALALIVLTVLFELPIRWLHATAARSPREARSVLSAMALVWKDLGSLTCRIGVRI